MLAKDSTNFGMKIPRHEIEELAYFYLPKIQKYFESEEGKREFEEWERQQEETNTD